MRHSTSHGFDPMASGSSASGSGSCGSGFTPVCELQELPAFPQVTYSQSEGLVGLRRWFATNHPDIKDALRKVCASHWPGDPDCLPMAVQCGAPDEKVQVHGNIPIGQISDRLPTYDQYLIIAQYKLLRISDPWPITGKPAHPAGTTLTLQVGGGGEMLQIDPTAMTGGAAAGGFTGCFNGTELAPGTPFNSRIRIPLTEYHITCDRITDKQLCAIMRGRTDGRYRAWRDREGTVNADTVSSDNGLFLAEDEGTLLFDTWRLEQTFVPDVDNPRRWRLSCTLKSRQVPEVKGPYPDDCNASQYPVGWNHDYKRSLRGKLGWQFIMLQMTKGSSEARWTPHGECRTGFVPRYPYAYFWDLFCDDAKQRCEAEQEPACTNARAQNRERELTRIIADARGAQERRQRRTKAGELVAQ